MGSNLDYQGYRQEHRGRSDEMPVRSAHDLSVIEALESLEAAPNLLVTPNVSADDGDNYVPITLQLFFENPGHYLSGEALKNVMRPEPGH
ncbi:MAG: hypothetical protein OEO19_13985 [Gammaproteobacteria bacterium]|nr:hypothetical protein [Gammaproteobacteria bacterium]MDH3448193.1 hypothetical protein [Gammaproteobacteria bacterium]